MTSSRYHAVLFTKEACAPCLATKDFIYDFLDHNPAYTETLSFMKKENHSALVEAYNLNLYPTLLIVGPNGLEIDRVVGGKAVRDVIESKLTEIFKENNA